MSMNAMFVQVDDAEIQRFEADPDSVETLFAGDAMPSAAAAQAMTAAAERLRTATPEQIAAMLGRLPDGLRQQLEASLGRIAKSSAAGEGTPDLAKLLQERLAKRAQPPSAGDRETLSLEKAWHGVHYLLAGKAEPGPELRSQAVLGGTELGDDPEGFSGYGAARFFRAAEVRKLSEELSRPEVETEAAARFDAEKMKQLKIYPGWRGDADKEWVIDALHRLRDFYASAAAKGRAVVTCLV